ncbi:MAG: hypothetical protein COV75_08490 [Candidatus Omnitrophica bacterium CG11_big_fil_rev_8_21_14_0_20_63_9]|nr:MAG: hypothetical protein COV75_08490 [Candidatus Omnitrophica bacterium CG11_big_fil_rev_8_21_14_0_20_63_9]
MQRKSSWPGLASLDRHFEAIYSGDQLETLFPAGASRQLIRQGILQDAGLSLTIPRCICELRHPDCVVRVDGDGGAYRGYCNEYGVPINVSIDQIQRYRFVWSAWAESLRRANRLDGPPPIQGSGCVFIGEGIAAGRKYGLLVLAPGCRLAEDIVLPEGARQSDRALLALPLGEQVQDLAVDAVISADVLTTDLITINASALEQILDQLPLVISPGEAICLAFGHDNRKAHPITQAEYDRLHRRDVLKTFDLFVDVLHAKIWRNGRACGVVIDGSGRSTGKKLGDQGVLLLASYMKRPGIPMCAHKTSAYGDRVAPRTAAVMLSVVRRSIHGTAFLKSGARSSQPGETMYVFDPPSTMTWCLLDRLPQQ